MLGRGVPFVLRAPADGPRIFTTQEVLFRLPNGSEERLLATLENDGERMNIVCSSPLGMTLFTITLRQGTVTVDARVPLPKALDPRLLPALIQFAEWPLEDLRRGLAPDASLEEKDGVRTLSRKGKLLLSLRREGARRITLEIPAANVSAVITTLEE
jgi:hypothetical protein